MAETSEDFTKMVGLLSSINEILSRQPNRPPEPLMLDPSDKLFESLDQINTRLNAQNIKIERIIDAQANDHTILKEHDRILIRGSETTPSLQETIRIISKEQTNFIAGIKADQDARKKAKEADREKWKWAIIGLGFTIGPKMVWDVINFWITVVAPALHIP